MLFIITVGSQSIFCPTRLYRNIEQFRVKKIVTFRYMKMCGVFLRKSISVHPLLILLYFSSPYTTYEFGVLAVNNVGRGPKSVPAIATTGETSKECFFKVTQT